MVPTATSVQPITRVTIDANFCLAQDQIGNTPLHFLGTVHFDERVHISDDCVTRQNGVDCVLGVSSYGIFTRLHSKLSNLPKSPDEP